MCEIIPLGQTCHWKNQACGYHSVATIAWHLNRHCALLILLAAKVHKAVTNRRKLLPGRERERASIYTKLPFCQWAVCKTQQSHTCLLAASNGAAFERLCQYCTRVMQKIIGLLDWPRNKMVYFWWLLWLCAPRDIIRGHPHRTSVIVRTFRKFRRRCANK